MESEFYKLKSELLKALAHPTRLKILELVSENEELCVCEIHEKINLEQSNVSRHLAVLRQVGVLNSRKDGLKAMYSLKETLIKNILETLDEVIINHFESQNAIKDRILKEK